MGKAVNEQTTVIAPHDLGFATSVVDAFKWIGHRFAGESIWVRKHRSNRHHPKVIEIEVQMRQQHASMARRDQTRCRNDRQTRLSGYALRQRSIVLCSDFSGGSAKRFCARGLSLFDPLPLVLGQPGYDDFGIYCLALENIRSTLRHILAQGRPDDRRAFKAETLAISHGAIHQRAVEQLPGATNKVPTQAMLPTSVVQIAEQALDVASILHKDVMVSATAAIELCSG